MRTVGSPLLGLTLSLVAACSEAPVPAGSAASGGTAGTAGAPAGGGGGAVSASGSAAVGGASAAGSGTTGGAGGATAGGMSGGAGAGGGVGHVPVPSAGCGKANPATGARTLQTGGQTGKFNVKLPDNYDATKPMPLGFGFHGFGNDECGPDQGECRGFAMLPAVTVYMKSLSDGWEQAPVLEQNVTYWQDVLSLMKNEYCIDESRVFVAGVSSGGQFIEHLTCRFGDKLWQTTAVCAGVVNAANQNCKGTPPVLVIHGVTDAAGDYGDGVVEMFAERNGCSATMPAGLAQARTDMTAAREAEQAKHVCLDLPACTANPVRFCISSQITYDGLTHGWPQVGGTLISEFQATIK